MSFFLGPSHFCRQALYSSRPSLMKNKTRDNTLGSDQVSLSSQPIETMLTVIRSFGSILEWKCLADSLVHTHSRLLLILAFLISLHSPFPTFYFPSPHRPSAHVQATPRIALVRGPLKTQRSEPDYYGPAHNLMIARLPANYHATPRLARACICTRRSRCGLAKKS